MFFVFHAIDVLFLNKDKNVVEIKENFRPFAMYNPKNKAKFVIELKKGMIGGTGTEIGDYIDFTI